MHRINSGGRDSNTCHIVDLKTSLRDDEVSRINKLSFDLFGTQIHARARLLRAMIRFVMTDREKERFVKWMKAQDG